VDKTDTGVSLSLDKNGKTDMLQTNAEKKKVFANLINTTRKWYEKEELVI
jgi:hypothetical protein